MDRCRWKDHRLAMIGERRYETVLKVSRWDSLSHPDWDADVFAMGHHRLESVVSSMEHEKCSLSFGKDC